MWHLNTADTQTRFVDSAQSDPQATPSCHGLLAHMPTATPICVGQKPTSSKSGPWKRTDSHLANDRLLHEVPSPGAPHPTPSPAGEGLTAQRGYMRSGNASRLLSTCSAIAGRGTVSASPVRRPAGRG